jgi:hypothetical protein
MTNDKYNYYHGKMIDLDEWIEKHQDIFNRCTFNLSWIWDGPTYIDSFNVNLMSEPIHNDYDIRKNKKFFHDFKVEKEIGHFSGELFHKINKIKNKNNLSSGASMGISEDGFIVYSTSCKKDEVIQLSKLIEENFNLHCRIKKEFGRMEYKIYLHSNKEKLDSLDFENFTGKPIKKPKKVSSSDWQGSSYVSKGDDLEEKNEQMLKLMKRDLLKQLSDINKKLKT